ncbi:MAG TPA: hypothetical protein VNA88_12235 [Candidatus Kapabacteria bacterium]|jgi:hypothetical protein|nr:hypothetical protein [Candidatus Kapabacteria bacterium]
MHRKRFLAAVVAAAIAVLAVEPAAAQTDGGSSYSIFNIGDVRQTVTASGTGRGGIEASTTSEKTINGTNPALWGDLGAVSIQAALSFVQYHVSDASSSLYQNRTALQNFSAGFPVSETYRAAFALMIRPYSTVNYLTQTTSRVPTATGDSTDATISYSGDGGITEATFGGSFAPIPELTVGVAGTRYFGAIRNASGVKFPDESLNPAVYQRNDLFGGWGMRAGVAVRPVEGLTIGGVFETGAELTRERHDIAAYVDQSTQVVDTTDTRTETVTIPPRITAAASFLTGRALLSAQGTFQSWPIDEYPDSRSSMRMAVGFDRIGRDAAGTTGFDRWTLRAGAFYDQTYYSIAGNGIDEIGVAIGASIPITTVSRLNVGTTLDLGFEIGQRGSTDNGLTQELFGRLNVELAVGELWFIRSRR